MKRVLWKQNHPGMGRKNLGTVTPRSNRCFPPISGGHLHDKYRQAGGAACRKGAGVAHGSDVPGQRHQGVVFDEDCPERGIARSGLLFLRLALRRLEGALEG